MAYKINQRSLLFNAFIEESKQILKKLAIEVLEKWYDMDEPFAFMLFKRPKEKPDCMCFAEDKFRLTGRVQRIVMNVWGWPSK